MIYFSAVVWMTVYFHGYSEKQVHFVVIRFVLETHTHTESKTMQFL